MHTERRMCLLNMLVINDVQKRIPMLTHHTHINAPHGDPTPLPLPPSAPPRQISAEDRTLRHGNKLRRSSSTPMRSHGNPHTHRPVRLHVAFGRRPRIALKFITACVHGRTTDLRGGASCSSKVAAVVSTRCFFSSRGRGDKRQIIPFHGRWPHGEAARVF